MDYKERLEAMLADLRNSDIIAFDTESHELGGKPYRISLATKDHAYSCCLEKEDYHGFGYIMDLKWLGWLLKTRKVILHNAKYDMKVMKKWFDIDIPDYEDTMILAFLLDETSPKGLKNVAQRYLKVKNWDVDLDTKLGKKKLKVNAELLPDKRPPKKWSNAVEKLRKEFEEEGLRDIISIKKITDAKKRDELLTKYVELTRLQELVKMTDEEYAQAVELSKKQYTEEERRMFLNEKSSEEEYSRLDARYTYDLYEPLRAKLEEEKLTILYERIERPLIAVLVDMELNGVPIDVDGVTEVERKATERLTEVNAKIATILGDEINIASSKQLSQALFESGMCEPIAPRSEKSGCYSVDAATMEELAKRGYEVAKLILESRNYQKLLSTYMFKEDRLYSEFNQVGTKTGRFCVSADTEILTDKGYVDILKIFLDKDTKYSTITHKGNTKEITDKIYKGKEEMYEISLQNGGKLRCTKAHRVLTFCGWKSVGDLREGDEILTCDFEITNS